MASRLLSKAGILLCFVGIMNPCPAQDWVRMSGITDMFYEVKALSGTDTLIVSTAESGMYWTSDVGETWHVLSTPTQSIVSHEIFRNQGQVQILVVALTAPYLYRSADMGQSWSPAAGQMPYLRSHRLYLDRYSRLWAFSENQIYFSDDYGTAWDSVSVAPEVTRVRNVWVSPQDSSKLWVAADTAGAYFSPNRGQAWTRSFVGGDVHDVEGNPQNPYSAIAIMYEDEMYWNHGDGIWNPVNFPVSGWYGDLAFLDDDSTQLLGIRGYQGYYTTDNILRSDDGGLSWSLDAGPLITAAGWRIQQLEEVPERNVVLLNAGALLADTDWGQHRRLSVGSLLAGQLAGCYTISQHQPALIWGWELGGMYISTDGGINWVVTPFSSGIMNGVEHTGRTAQYLIEYDLDLYLLSYPSLYVEELLPVPEPCMWLKPSEADTSVLYLAGFWGNLYVNHGGGLTEWQQIENPADPDWWCNLCTSSTQPGFALLSNTDFTWGYLYPPPSVWRTMNYGESWELIFRTNVGLLFESWSGADVLTEFYFITGRPGIEDSEYKFFCSLDGGENFDSVQTCFNGEGYYCWSWGDSVMVLSVDFSDVDSIYITPDHFQTLQYRFSFPEGVQTCTFDGEFSQLISQNHFTGATFYHGPSNAIPHQNPRKMIPQDLSISIYPNPTNSVAFINLTGTLATDPIQIRIYDILGRQAGSFQIKSPGQTSISLPLPINNLASGMYFVTVENMLNRQSQVQKVIVLK